MKTKQLKKTTKRLERIVTASSQIVDGLIRIIDEKDPSESVEEYITRESRRYTDEIVETIRDAAGQGYAVGYVAGAKAYGSLPPDSGSTPPSSESVDALADGYVQSLVIGVAHERLKANATPDKSPAPAPKSKKTKSKK